MEIRAVTVFANPGFPPKEKVFPKVGKAAHALRLVYEAADFAVQSARLATVPFPLLASSQNEAVDFAVKVEKAARQHGIEYSSIGPALPKFAASYEWIPAILRETESVFLGGVMAEGATVYPKAVNACARAIKEDSTLEPDGFANLRFAALAEVGPFAPFFPAAYAAFGDGSEGMLGFSLAIETAPLAVEVFSAAKNVPEAISSLAAEIERLAGRLALLSEEMAASLQTRFLGIDFSFAPFPEESASFGEALERLGVSQVGAHGTLAAAGIAAAALDEANFPRVGFNGLMLSVLEDSTLARRAAEGALGVKDLLLYSAVCGTGLDTVPLAGDATVEQLAAVLLDVAALAVRLRKPLTARLLPIPGKRAGDAVHFDFPYFADSAVLPLEAGGVDSALASPVQFALKARHQIDANGGGNVVD